MSSLIKYDKSSGKFAVKTNVRSVVRDVRLIELVLLDWRVWKNAALEVAALSSLLLLFCC